MSFIFGSSGGGGGGGGSTTTGTQTNIAREAPEVEARKLSLYDQAAKLATSPVNLPGQQVAPLTSLEQAGITQSGVTGVGSSALNTGLASLTSGSGALGNAAGYLGSGSGYLGNAQTAFTGAQQTAAAAPNINQFLNPYQSYVTDEIGRQGQIMSNQISANAVNSGAFGGGREGVQQAELQGQTLDKMGASLGQGFTTAAGLAGQQQALGAQTQLSSAQGLGQLGSTSGQLGQIQGQIGQAYGQLGQQQAQLGQQQQQMSQGDINQQMMAGSLQRGVGQQGLEATRQTALQKAYEPYQRVEFLKGIMTNLPTTQSSITATTAPGANPLSQAVGTGLGAYSAYNMMQPKGK